MDRVTMELAALRAAMADARTEREQTLGEAVDRMINTVEAEDPPAAPPPPPQRHESPPTVRIRHGRHQPS
jgi:hypothetical protein